MKKSGGNHLWSDISPVRYRWAGAPRRTLDPDQADTTTDRTRGSANGEKWDIILSNLGYQLGLSKEMKGIKSVDLFNRVQAYV